MTRTMTWVALAFSVAAVLAVPGKSYAGAMIKEHECVGADTLLNKAAEDAGCTPLGSVIMPPGGPNNHYGPEDVDDFFGENFSASGALEVITVAFPFGGSNMWQTIPTIKEPGFLQQGFDASFTWDIGIKSSSVLSDFDVVCSVCAERPQGQGPGETFVPFGREADGVLSGSGAFVSGLNVGQEPWTLWAQHVCSAGNPACGGTFNINSITMPGLRLVAPVDDGRWVEFQGCKPKILRVENDGTYFRLDRIRVRLDVPAAARLHGNLDATSCEVSYIRGCLPGEGIFKEICIGEP